MPMRAGVLLNVCPSDKRNAARISEMCGLFSFVHLAGQYASRIFT